MNKSPLKRLLELNENRHMLSESPNAVHTITSIQINPMITRLSIYISVFSLLILFLVAPSHSLINSPLYEKNCETGSWPHELSDLDPDPDIIFGRLANGLRYVLKTNQYPKDRTAILLNVNAGSLHETSEENGIAHFLEHMVFNGSTHFKPGELIKYFQDIGMSYGGDTNAYTTYEDTVYKIILPTSDKKMLEDGLLVMGDYARGALLEQSEIDRERGVVLAEMNARETASFKTYRASTSFSFNGTLLPKRPVIGQKDILEEADRNIVKGFYDKWYRPDNMVLVMVGDFQPEEAKNMISRQFSHFESMDEKFTCPDYGVVSHDGIQPFFHPEPDLGYTSVSIEQVQNKTPENDSYLYQVKNLHRYMAARIINFRLEQEREKPDSILSSARFYFGSTLDRYQRRGITAQTSGEEWQEALKILNRILKQAIEFGFSDDEIEMVKSELLSGLRRAVQTAASKSSTTLAQSIVMAINNNRVMQSPLQEEQLYGPKIIAATTTDLHEALLEEWQGDQRLLEVVGDADIVGGNKALVIKKHYLDLQKEKVVAKSEQAVPDFPYLTEPEPVEPEKHEILPTVDSARYTYRNGTVLNVKKTPFKRNSVSVAIHFGDGKKSLQRGGLSLLAEAVINGSGTGTLKDSEMSMVLAGNSISYRFKVGEDSLYLRGQALSSDIEILFQVMQSILLDPGMRSDVYNAAMKRFDLMYQGFSGDINGGAMLYLEPFFAGNSITHGLPGKDAFKSLSLDDVEGWLLPQLRDEKLEINVVGDINEPAIVSLTSKYFGSLPKRVESEKNIFILPVFPAGETFDTSIQLNEDKGLVQMAWLTDDYWDIKRTRRLHLLAAIIDERLRKLIREKSGDSYSPAAFISTSRIYPGFGKIIAKVLTDGASVDSVIDQIEEVVQSLHDSPISKDELERAKQPALTSIKDRVKTNEYWLTSVLSLSSRYPQQLSWSQTFLDDYRSITIDDMSFLVETYMTKERLASGIIRAMNAVQH